MSRNKNFVITCIFATISLLSVALIWNHNSILFAILIFSAILMLLIEKSKNEVKTFIFCSISGAAAECVAISFGAWTYKNPNFFTIPIWLPLLWGISSIFIIRVYKYFSKYK